MPAVAAKSSENKTQQHTGSATGAGVETQIAGPYADILLMQQQMGNRAVRQIIQAKLSVSTPGDRYEQEADSIAEQVMRSTSTGPRKIVGFPVGGFQQQEVQRECADCEAQVQRKSV